MSEAVFVQGLTKAYNGRTIVDYLNLSVKSGTVFGLRDAWPYRALHSAFHPFLPLGISNNNKNTGCETQPVFNRISAQSRASPALSFLYILSTNHGSVEALSAPSSVNHATPEFSASQTVSASWSSASKR